MANLDTITMQADLNEHGVIVESFGDRKVLLMRGDALALALFILEHTCRTCEGMEVAVNERGECADCSRNRLGREGGE